MPLVTPRRIRDAYAYLRTLPPFSRWQLPEASGVRFQVLHDPKTDADVTLGSGRPIIRVRPHAHLTLDDLLASVAHEMVHMRQHATGKFPADGDPHNRAFAALKYRVCQALGFDLQRFGG